MLKNKKHISTLITFKTSYSLYVSLVVHVNILKIFQCQIYCFTCINKTICITIDIINKNY